MLTASKNVPHTSAGHDSYLTKPCSCILNFIEAAFFHHI